MATPVRLYQHEMHENLGFFATWLPNDSIEIGDVGILEGGRFRRMTSLQELGITANVGEGRAKSDVQYSSTQGTKIETSTAGQAVGLAKAEISVEFSRQGAFLFQASRLQPRELVNRAEVSAKILEAYHRRAWDKAWFLVEAVHAADRATIIVAEDDSAGLVLSAEVQQAIPSISLVDPKLSLQVKSTRGKVMYILAQKGLHPLYSCLRVKDPLLGAAAVRPVRGNAGPAANQAFLRPGLDELLES